MGALARVSDAQNAYGQATTTMMTIRTVPLLPGPPVYRHPVGGRVEVHVAHYLVVVLVGEDLAEQLRKEDNKEIIPRSMAMVFYL